MEQRCADRIYCTMTVFVVFVEDDEDLERTATIWRYYYYRNAVVDVEARLLRRQSQRNRQRG